MNQGLSRRQKRELRQLQEDIEKVLEHPPARRVLIWVLMQCGINSPSFTGNSETFYREGRRAVGIDLVNALTSVKPMAYAELLAESVKLTQRAEYEAQQEQDQEHDD